MGLKMFGKKKTLLDYTEPFKTNSKARKVLLRTRLDKVTVEDIKRSLSHLMETSPIEVYAIVLDILRAPRKVTWRGFTRSMEDIARSAARKSLHDRPLDTRTTEMNIRLDDYTRFTLYHTRCAIRLLDFFVAEDFTKKTGTGWVWYNTRCEVCLPASNCTVVRDGAQENAKHPAIWWVDYWGKIVASVRDSPCERLVDEEPIWASTLHDLAKECPTCHEAAEREFPVFKATLVAEIKRIVDGIELEISP